MKHTTVIDIGSGKVCCMEAGTASDGALIIHGAEVRPYSGYRLGSLPQAAPLGEAVFSALSALQDNTGLRIRTVCVGVPAPFVKTAVTECGIDVASRSGRVTEQDLNFLFASASAFDLPEGYELMHTTPFDYSLDGTLCDGSPIGLPADKLSAKFCHAFVDSRFSRLIVGMLDSMGVSVGSFVSSGAASAAFTIPFETRMSGAVLIDCGATHTDVSVIRGNALLRTESIGIGGDHFTNDIALGLRLPRRTAEELKRRYVFGLDYGDSAELVRIPNEGMFEIEHSTIQMIVEARAEELAVAVSEACDSLETELSGKAPVYIVGGGLATMRGADEYLSKATGREVRLNMPQMSRMNSVSHAPVLALAQFMLYGGAVQGAYRQPAAVRGGRILENIKEFFTAGR